MTSQKIFLFLQSHPSGFSRSVIRQLREQEVSCHIFNFSLGDWFCNFGLGACNYVGKVRNWRVYLEKYIAEHGITDIIYYADQRPYHRIARALARQYGLNVYAYEFGYLRPDWITLECGGMGAFSHFPNDPDVICELASKVSWTEPKGHYPYTFPSEAFYEVFYHTSHALFPFFFPHYRHDRYYHPIIDYLSFLPRLFVAKGRSKRAEKTISRLLEKQSRFFLVAMQLQSDYQIRRASRYIHLSEMIDEILRSFVEHAEPDTDIVFKLHPLDNNFERWPKVIEKRAVEFGCQDRVKVIDGGDLVKIITSSKGVVLINSTVGLAALQFGVPVKPLGVAVYDVPKMCFQGPLDDFWTKATPPDRTVLAAFVKLLKTSIQVKGNFFTRQGRTLATNEFARRILQGDVNNDGAFIDPPPRLEKARKMGVPMKYEG